MDGKVLVINRNTPWMSKKDLAKELGCSTSYITKLIEGIRKEIGTRYSPYVIAGERYNFYAIVDYATFRDRLNDKNLREYVPKFNPKEIANLSGFYQNVVSINQ